MGCCLQTLDTRKLSSFQPGWKNAFAYCIEAGWPETRISMAPREAALTCDCVGSAACKSPTFLRTITSTVGLAPAKLIPATLKDKAVLDAPRAELARQCRRVWLERERNTASVDLNSEQAFRDVLAEVQRQFGAETLSEEDFREVIALEEKRVADACVLAEILLPRLATLLRNKTAESVTAISPSLPHAEPRPTSRAISPVSVPVGIADLIDGMLNQERK